MNVELDSFQRRVEMRLLVASSSFLVSYLAFNNVSLSLGISLIAAFLYEDLPSNVDNFYATYVLVKVMKFNGNRLHIRSFNKSVCFSDDNGF